jgi:membrane-associated protease RseP (regulator of RpoE activity)
LHELGHFIPARIFKTRVEKFYLFFDPWFSIWKKKIGDEVAAGITAVAFLICAVLLLVAGAANVWAGNALKRRQPNGRLGTLVLAVPNLFVLPFGTALGIYAFWVLLQNEARAKFEPQRTMGRGAEGANG